MSEIRRIRQEHAANFNFDLDAIFEDLKEKQQKSGRKTVSLPRRRAKAQTPDDMRKQN